jgi:glycosyltransferase involved in cell wall biosynthesis
MTSTETCTGCLPQRVMLTTDCVGGIWTYSLGLARQLSERGCSVLLAATGPAPSGEQLATLKGLPDVLLMYKPFRLEWMKDGWVDQEPARAWLARLAREFKPGVVHVNGYALAAADVEAPVISVAHSCVYSWWMAVHGTEPPSEWEPYRRGVITGLRSARVCVAPSRTMLAAIHRHYGSIGEREQVVYNAASSFPISGVAKRPFILAAGRVWDRSKNLPLLEEIASRVDWPVRIAGSLKGPDNQIVGSLTNTFIGEVAPAKIQRLMAEASIFAHPALYEPFGLGVLEATQHRCALVLANVDSLRELWDGCAVFCPARDPGAWIRALNQLSADRELREKLASLAFERASVYNTEKMFNTYCDLYRELTPSYQKEFAKA